MQHMTFIADFIACSTCFGQYYAHHQELESFIQMVAAVLWFSGYRYVVELKVMCPVCRLLLYCSKAAACIKLSSS